MTAAKHHEPRQDARPNQPSPDAPHYYVAPFASARNAPCARCGRDWADPRHLKPPPGL